MLLLFSFPWESLRVVQVHCKYTSNHYLTLANFTPSPFLCIFTVIYPAVQAESPTSPLLFYLQRPLQILSSKSSSGQPTALLWRFISRGSPPVICQATALGHNKLCWPQAQTALNCWWLKISFISRTYYICTTLQWVVSSSSTHNGSF